jgi:hypothetical protein
MSYTDYFEIKKSVIIRVLERNNEKHILLNASYKAGV